jgi:hypothetical protein
VDRGILWKLEVALGQLKSAQAWFKNSVRTSKRTPHFTITTINLLTLFKEIIPVYAENDTKPTNKNETSLIDKADGTYSYLPALKG